MAPSILNPREPGEHVSLEAATRGIVFPGLRQEAGMAAEPEEVLVADVRGRLSPVQMVDQKLLALLGRGSRGGAQATCDSAASSRWEGARRAFSGRSLTGATSALPAERLHGEDRMSAPLPKVETSGNVTIITFTGREAPGYENRITSELDGCTEALGDRHLLLDFTNVDRINSEELGTLIRLHKAVAAAGGRLTLFNLDPAVYEVFKVTRLQTFLAICRE